jgi:hypothetical protein
MQSMLFALLLASARTAAAQPADEAGSTAVLAPK